MKTPNRCKFEPMKRLLLIPLVLFLLFCQNDYEKVEVTDVIVKSGVSFGFCRGYCKSDIEIVNRGVVFIASSWSDPNYPDIMLNDNISIQEWDSLIESVDMDILLSMEDIIGCPDCYDGGGEWIEIIKANTIKRVTFEYGSTVEPIQNLIEKVKVIRERFYCEVFPDKC